MMKCVKTARCLSLSMKAFCPLSAWMLKFQRGLSVSKRHTQIRVFLSNRGHSGETYDIFAYAVWYVRQLKFLVLRQDRKLEDEEARSGAILAWNQLRTKVSFCSSACVKLESLTCAKASSAAERDGLLALGAWNRKHCISCT